MDERWGFWIFIGVLILMMFLLNFFSCLGGCYYKFEQNYIQKDVKDFCGEYNVLKYFSSKNSCCAAKMSCGNGLRGQWSKNNEVCEC